VGYKNPDDVLLACVEAYRRLGNQKDAAAEFGIRPNSFSERMSAAAERGLLGTEPVLPGFVLKRISRTTGPDGELKSESTQQVKAPGEIFELQAGHVVDRLSVHTDAEGHITNQWTKIKAGQITVDEAIERVKRAMAGFKPAAKPAPAPRISDAKLLTLIPCNDWHVGMFAWGREVDFNWDLKIAERVIRASIEDVIARSPASGRAIVLGGGDLLHADSGENKTAKSGNVLDVDGRYQKVIDVACRLMAHTVDAALRRHKRVTVRILKGNHDEHACVAVAYYLLAWYRKDKRVTVDVDPSLFFWFRHGSVMLAATHGHLAKLKDMPGIMAHRRSEDWGATRFRYAHGFHIHHKEKIATEGNGCICETHQAPIPQDSWHYGKGFLSGRSVQAITYHKDFGEFGRVNTMILDAT
jgi:ribosomal protein L4